MLKDAYFCSISHAKRCDLSISVRFSGLIPSSIELVVYFAILPGLLYRSMHCAPKRAPHPTKQAQLLVGRV